MTEYLQSEEYLNRTRKLEEIRPLLDPYPAHWPVDHSIATIVEQFSGNQVGSSEEAERGETPHTRLSGRIVLMRPMGKNCFMQIQEGTERIQVMFNKQHSAISGLSEEPMKFVEKRLDLGDIIGVEGELFRTQRGELTLYAKSLTLLCKALLPLPEKHSGLQEIETRYRKRWLDLISHKEVLQTFLQRSQILREVRIFFDERGFMEVETPILQNFYGGAEAAPFTTHVNALDQEMFLRISLEPSLKKLLVGGHSKVFEIGKVFRNESIDRTHNPEFTLLEAYAANADFRDMMELVETLFERLALKLHGTTKIKTRHPKTDEIIEIDLKAPWKAMTMRESLKEYAGIDVDAATTQELRTHLMRTPLPPEEYKDAPHGVLTALLFEEFVEQHLLQPHHIYEHPIETTPLCKPDRDLKKRTDGFVERFESFILAAEFCNAYSELNDPILQRELLEKQSARDAITLDEEFLEAICQGMPPAGGIGIGIDRLVCLLTAQASLRDVLYFPLVKPKKVGE